MDRNTFTAVFQAAGHQPSPPSHIFSHFSRGQTRPRNGIARQGKFRRLVHRINNNEYAYSASGYTTLPTYLPVLFFRIKSLLGRSTIIEVHPNFSEAPHLRSSIPPPKTDSSKNQIASRRIIPWPESTNVFFRNQGWRCDDLGSRNPVFQKQYSRNVLPLS